MAKSDSTNLHSGEEILTLQNEPKNIELLKAMRQSYSKGKVILGWLFVLNIGVVIVLALLTWKFKTQTWNEVIAIYGVVITVIDLFILTPWMKDWFEKGASIQDMFDRRVFGLKLNPVLRKKAIDSLQIKQLADSYQDNPKAPLEDWYTVDSSLKSKEAVKTAQAINPAWEKNQKQNWQRLINILILFTMAATFLLLVYVNLDFVTTLAYALPAILPAIVFGAQYRQNLKSDIEAAENIASFINACELEAYNKHKAREVQDALFEYRKNNMPVFDWTYNNLRAKLESFFGVK